MMIRTPKTALSLLICSLLGLSLLGCQPPSKEESVQEKPQHSSVQKSGYLVNYGEPNIATLVQRLNNASKQQVNILQLGDSHTAADIFSGRLRQRFQSQFGNGGIGFIPAVRVPGTRLDQVKITSAKGAWQLTSSRNQQSDIFPLGGYLATPIKDNASVRIENLDHQSGPYRLSVLYFTNKNAAQENQLQVGSRILPLKSTPQTWQWSQALTGVHLPVELKVRHSLGIDFGGLYLTSARGTGVVFSALGINGATINNWDKWQEGWQQSLQALSPSLIILAYGTNEAFNDDLDPQVYKTDLTAKINMLRQSVPNAAILIVGAPDSIKARKNTSAGCAERLPPRLHDVIAVQQAVAREQKTLYWDWQGYMGGDCAILNWQANNLARNDLVHFTAEGYNQSAQALYQDLSSLFR